MIYSRWRPWRDVAIETWLIAMGDWQLRVHRIRTARALDTAEGGFSVPNRPLPEVQDGEGGCRIITPADTSAILCLSPQRRCGEAVLTPPNSNLLFAERAAVPVLRGDLAPGTHLLLSAVWAGNPDTFAPQGCPQAFISDDAVRFVTAQEEKHLTLSPENVL
jgi:hypothetical protein